MSNFANRSRQGSLNLEQQKKLAKALLSDFKAGKAAALQRFQHHHPEWKHSQILDSKTFPAKLSDAQLVIARELGFPSWAKLKAHLQTLEQARQSMTLGRNAAPDADLTTLHLRCGSDIQHKLKLAGFTGDFLEFADPYCQGPVPDDSNLQQFLQLRAAFLSAAYGITVKDAEARLAQEYTALHRSSHYQRIVLWFEHDAYDQLILARLLRHFLTPHHRPRHLELICVDSFPGIQPFVGLGQLAPEELRSLWESRQAVTEAQLQLGDRLWQALTSSSPEGLYHIAQTQTPPLPQLAPAIWRHLQELPGTEAGLGLTEWLTLNLLAEQEFISGEQLFMRLTREKESLPFLGDTMYWRILHDLSQGQSPFEIRAETADLPWANRVLCLNKVGQALLRKELNWLQISRVDRWVGGVHILSQKPVWTWDEAAYRPLFVA